MATETIKSSEYSAAVTDQYGISLSDYTGAWIYDPTELQVEFKNDLTFNSYGTDIYVLTKGTNALTLAFKNVGAGTWTAKAGETWVFTANKEPAKLVHLATNSVYTVISGIGKKQGLLSDLYTMAFAAVDPNNLVTVVMNSYTDSTIAEGTTLYIINNAHQDDYLDVDGNSIAGRNFFGISSGIWFKKSTSHVTYHISFRTPSSEYLNLEFQDWISAKGKMLKVVVGPVSSAGTSLIQFTSASVSVEDASHEVILIDNKKVKSMSINGTVANDITVDGLPYSFINDIAVTEQEVKSHIRSNTTWAANIATIDTTAKLKGLAVEYSKSTGIADGEQITATVKYDSAVAEHLNGGTSDVVYTGLVIANPGRTITEAQVKAYADANSGLKAPTPITDATISDTEYTSGKVEFVNHSSHWIQYNLSGYKWSPEVHQDKTLAITFKNDITGKALNNFDIIIYTEPTGAVRHSYGYFYKYTYPIDINIKAGETWIFMPGLEPVRAGDTDASSTIELTVSDSDYTSVNRSTPYANVLHLVDYTWPATVETKDGVVLTFKNDIDTFFTSSDHFWIAKGDTFGADAIKVMTSPWPSMNFKAGETWYFSTKSTPHLYTGTPSGNLDITKWPSLHPGTKLYTPDLHMVDGKEITLTVQADHGFTVNGQANIDYQYTPSSVPPYTGTTHEIKSEDYTTVTQGSYQGTIQPYYFSLNGWTKGPGHEIDIHPADNARVLITFNNDYEYYPWRNSDTYLVFGEPHNTGNSYLVYGKTFTEKMSFKKDEVWSFVAGEDPVKVS